MLEPEATLRNGVARPIASIRGLPTSAADEEGEAGDVAGQSAIYSIKPIGVLATEAGTREIVSADRAAGFGGKIVDKVPIGVSERIRRAITADSWTVGMR